MKLFRTALLFPPVWYYPNTPAEVAYLAAYLRTRGIEPYVRDLSIEMFDLILEEDWLKDIYHRLLQEWQSLDAKDNLLPFLGVWKTSLILPTSWTVWRQEMPHRFFP